jgi:hypothetical protein
MAGLRHDKLFMRKPIYSLLYCVVLLATPARADELPFFSPLREELVAQLTLASNAPPPVDKRLISTLNANLKLIDRTKPMLINGSAALGTLAKALGKTSLSNVFLPVIQSTRTAYSEFMVTELDDLDERLRSTIPGKTQTAAQTAMSKVSAALDGVETNSNLTLSLKSLSKAATALVAAGKAVTKAELAPPGAEFLTATIVESNQPTNTFKPNAKTYLDVYFDPFSGELEIDAGTIKSLGGAQAEVRFVSLAAIVAGEGINSLSLTNADQGYAIYQRGLVPNIRVPDPEIEVQETYFTIDPINERLGSGVLTVTVRPDKNLVWGSFTFAAKGSNNSNREVSVTGSFLLRYESWDY